MVDNLQYSKMTENELKILQVTYPINHIFCCKCCLLSGVKVPIPIFQGLLYQKVVYPIGMSYIYLQKDNTKLNRDELHYLQLSR